MLLLNKSNFLVLIFVIKIVSSQYYFDEFDNRGEEFVQFSDFDADENLFDDEEQSFVNFDQEIFTFQDQENESQSPRFSAIEEEARAVKQEKVSNQKSVQTAASSSYSSRPRNVVQVTPRTTTRSYTSTRQVPNNQRLVNPSASYGATVPRAVDTYSQPRVAPTTTTTNQRPRVVAVPTNYGVNARIAPTITTTTTSRPRSVAPSKSYSQSRVATVTQGYLKPSQPRVISTAQAYSKASEPRVVNVQQAKTDSYSSPSQPRVVTTNQAYSKPASRVISTAQSYSKASPRVLATTTQSYGSPQERKLNPIAQSTTQKSIVNVNSYGRVAQAVRTQPAPVSSSASSSSSYSKQASTIRTQPQTYQRTFQVVTPATSTSRPVPRRFVAIQYPY
jgi:hypothetical protein